jgi:hypothetical protein
MDRYIMCVSEHTSREDAHGRLSMCRAYGGRAGVALVLYGAVMFSGTDALGAYASPVLYVDPYGFAAELMRVAKGMAGETEYISQLGRDCVRSIVFNMFRFAVLCTKHPGFHEEREWRVVASPTMHPSKLLTQGVEVVRGTPQTILNITLRNEPQQGLIGLAVPDLLDRIIIGPCELPTVIFRAMHELLTSAGVADAANKIVVSDIPLRNT